MTAPAVPPDPLPDRPDESDAALLARYVKDRDAAAFAELVRRFGPLVWGVCRRRLGGSPAAHQHAEDAFQAAFLTLALKAEAVRDPAALPGWLHRTALRAAGRAARRADRDASPADFPDLPADGPDALAELARREALGAFDEEVARLPAADRAAVVLCHLHGLTRTEAAVRLGVSGATVKGRLARGRARLRTRLARRGFALPLLAPAATFADPAPAAAADLVCRLVDPLALSGAHAPFSSFLPDWSEKGLSAMNFLKSRPAAALLTAAACVALIWLFQPAPPAAAGGGNDGFAAGTDGPPDRFAPGRQAGRLDSRLSEAPAPAAFGGPAVRLAGFEANAPAGAGGTPAPKLGGGAGPSGAWERRTPFGTARLALDGGRLTLDLDLNVENELVLRGSLEADYFLTGPDTLVAVVQSAEVGPAAPAAGFDEAAIFYASAEAALMEQPFLLRFHHRDGRLTVKDVKTGLSEVVLTSFYNSSGEGAVVSLYKSFALGRWDAVGR